MPAVCAASINSPFERSAHPIRYAVRTSWLVRILGAPIGTFWSSSTSMRQPGEPQYRTHPLDWRPLEYLFGDLLGGKPVSPVLDHVFYVDSGSLDDPLSRHLARLPLDIRRFRPIHRCESYLWGLTGCHSAKSRRTPLQATTVCYAASLCRAAALIIAVPFSAIIIVGG